MGMGGIPPPIFAAEKILNTLFDVYLLGSVEFSCVWYRQKNLTARENVIPDLIGDPGNR